MIEFCVDHMILLERDAPVDVRLRGWLLVSRRLVSRRLGVDGDGGSSPPLDVRSRSPTRPCPSRESGRTFRASSDMLRARKQTVAG